MKMTDDELLIWQHESLRLAARGRCQWDGEPIPHLRLLTWFTNAALALLLMGLLVGCGTTQLASCKGDTFALNAPPVVAASGVVP